MRFEQLLAKGIENRHMPAKTQRARLWYRSRAEHLQGFTVPTDDHKRLRDNVQVGSMYMYTYDPKTKDKLPYYDTFPVIFVVGPAEGGFYGLNIHYLPPKLRAKLMDGLYKYASDDKYDEKTKLGLSYELLKSVAKLKYFEPCLKRYLISHVRSQFMYVYPYEWDICLMLPLQQFEKKSFSEVWADSQRKIRAKGKRRI